MSGKSIGVGLDRVDGRKKVTGAAQYSAEIPVADVAHAVLVPSAIAKGRITLLDASRAESAPGVLAVLTHLNAKGLLPESAPNEKKELTDRVLHLLQDDRVSYARQPIALVIADTFERATDAATRLAIEYASEAPKLEMEKDIERADHPKPAPEAKSELTRGDVAAGLAKADAKIDAVYTTPFEHHNPMEMHATIAVWQGDRLTLYDTTQGVFGTRGRASSSFHVPKDNVRVISHYLGGGFGCKGSAWSHVILAAMAARKLGRPVKIVLPREQMFASVGGRPHTRQHVVLAAKRDGTLTAIKHDSISATSTFDEFVEHTTAPSRALYSTPNYASRERLSKLDIGTPTFMRGPGEVTGQFALESAMDELAYALAIDPVALRLKNYAEVDPETNKPWSSKSLRECYRQAGERFGWAKRNPAPRSTREGKKLIGWGMASSTYPAHLRPAHALARLEADRAVVLAGSQDIGTGTYTIMTQIAAETLGLEPEQVFFDLGDTTMPETPVSGGSQTAASVGSAVRGACKQLRKELIDLARADAQSPVSGAPEGDVIFEGGKIFSESAPAKSETYQALLARAGKKTLETTFENKPSADREKFQTRAFGAQFVEVRVDEDLGEVRVSRVVSAFACGKILNPKTARSQFLGGICWGIGMALTEQSLYDHRFGRVMNADLGEYHVPVNADVNAIEVISVPEEDPHVNELGIKGIGEIPICGAAAAIANAVYHATGKRIRDLPITVDKLL